MSLIAATDRMDIYLEENRGIILVRQRWRYNWLVKDATEWTYQQKTDFHRKADDIIWKTWGNKFKIRTRGTSDLAKKFADKTLTINFDIKWVIEKAHWDVNITKVARDTLSPRSNIHWNAREINIDTKDTILTHRGNNKYQFPIAHEFGHTIGNSIYALRSIGSKNPRGDEYNSSLEFRFDKDSIMNVGNKLRDRHLEYILNILNTSVIDTKFYIYSL